MSQPLLPTKIVIEIMFLLFLVNVQDASCHYEKQGCCSNSSQFENVSNDQVQKVMLEKALQVENATKIELLSNRSTDRNRTRCRPWFYHNITIDKCQCGPSPHHIISCNKTSAVLDCNCVTFDETRNAIVAGACFYNCENVNNKQKFDVVYHTLPITVSELNEHMCGRFKRTGPLCGQCVKKTSPLAYSYDVSCVTCPNGHKNWWKYIFAAFLPLTFFYFIVLFFKISATTSHLHGYVFYSQAISSPVFARVLFLTLMRSPTVLKVAFSLYSIWNLDFFRALLPNICLNTTTLQTLALDYAIAVYPLLLMIISYTLIELHDRNFKVVVSIWKPFRLVFTFVRRNWDCRTSVVDAYATFFLLSFTKFLSVSFDILTPGRLYVFNSNNNTFVLYYDASIEYFGREHLPYAILAIIVLLVFIILPVLTLFLYPFKFFQKFLGCFPTRWYTILHTFVESFLGCYKDGTEPGTRDYRWFAVLFLLWRILAQITASITVGSAYFPGATVTLILLVILLTSLRPFKSSVAHYTRINTTFVLILALFYTAVVGMDVSSIKAIRFYKPYYIFAVVIGCIPLVYMSFIVIHWLFAQRKWGKNLILKFKAWRQGYDWMIFENDQDFEDSLPDRIVNPDQYHKGNLSNFHSVSESRVDTRSLNTTVTVY